LDDGQYPYCFLKNKQWLLAVQDQATANLKTENLFLQTSELIVFWRLPEGLLGKEGLMLARTSLVLRRQ